jgi:hypothetical protein
MGRIRRRYDVVVWYRPKAGLAAQLVAHAGRDPYEGCETPLGGDLHWSFDAAADAVRCAESFFEFAATDDVTYLVVTPYGDEEFERKIYKDTRVMTT